MARKTRYPDFDQMLQALRARQFEISSYAGVSGGQMVSKGGVAAVLVPGKTNDRWESGGACLALKPGVLLRGQIARLLDRGYQKFIKAGEIEIPATAAQLQAIHVFEEELNQVTGALGLYNESLGTTSDVYMYDRVRGRDKEPTTGVRPWELTSGH